MAIRIESIQPSAITTAEALGLAMSVTIESLSGRAVRLGDEVRAGKRYAAEIASVLERTGGDATAVQVVVDVNTITRSARVIFLRTRPTREDIAAGIEIQTTAELWAVLMGVRCRHEDCASVPGMAADCARSR